MKIIRKTQGENIGSKKSDCNNGGNGARQD